MDKQWQSSNSHLTLGAKIDETRERGPKFGSIVFHVVMDKRAFELFRKLFVNLRGQKSPDLISYHFRF